MRVGDTYRGYSVLLRVFYNLHTCVSSLCPLWLKLIIVAYGIQSYDYCWGKSWYWFFSGMQIFADKFWWYHWSQRVSVWDTYGPSAWFLKWLWFMCKCVHSWLFQIWILLMLQPYFFIWQLSCYVTCIISVCIAHVAWCWTCCMMAGPYDLTYDFAHICLLHHVPYSGITKFYIPVIMFE